MARHVEITAAMNYRTFIALMDAINYEIADIEQEMETLEGDTLEKWREELRRLCVARDALLWGAGEVES